jgi:hypothetical protein
MKSPTIVAIGAIAMSACSTAATPPTDAMAVAGSGGTVETAGATSAGSAGAGNTTSAGAGNTTSAGAGNTTSEGGASAGTAGASTMGGAPSGGSTGTAGASGGSSGGSSAGAAGAGVIDPTTFTGGWDGTLVEYACGSKGGTGYDCPQPTNIGCKNVIGSNDPASVIPPSNGAKTAWTMGGTPGTVYDLTVNVRGVVEVTSYKGGVRDAGSTSILANGGLDLFQQGGVTQVNGDPSYDYNTYELHVTPTVNPTAKIDAGYDAYYMNAVMTSENPHAQGTPTTHHTYSINYVGHVKVAGGGTIKMQVTDSNCTQVQNCGPTSSGNVCTDHSTTSLAGTNPAAPASFVQPFVQPADAYGQWVYFDVTNVTVAQ